MIAFSFGALALVLTLGCIRRRALHCDRDIPNIPKYMTPGIVRQHLVTVHHHQNAVNGTHVHQQSRVLGSRRLSCSSLRSTHRNNGDTPETASPALVDQHEPAQPVLGGARHDSVRANGDEKEVRDQKQEAVAGKGGGGAVAAGEVGLSRKQLIRGMSAVAYGGLLVTVLGAENSPRYKQAVRDMIRGTVSRGGLNVLEVGFGTGPNLYEYPPGTALIGLDQTLQDTDSQAYDVARASRRGIRLRFVQGDGASLPFNDGVFDAVVMTKVLCSVDDPAAVLREVSRVLKSGGKFGFVEHVAADQGTLLEASQMLLDPVQQVVASKCHLHRDTDAAIARSCGIMHGATMADMMALQVLSDSPALFTSIQAADRYKVWRMWPIAQQASGVVVK